MARAKRPPAYRLHKASGQAFVELAGKRKYLGQHGSSDSRERYARLIAEWEAGGRVPTDRPADLTVVELADRFIAHAEQVYRNADGEPTGELAAYRSVIAPLIALYGRTRAAHFGPIALRAVRERMIERGWSRKSINRQVSRVRHVFKWGVGQELVPAAAWESLRAVEPLRAGRSGAKEPEAVRPVPEAHIERVRPLLSRQVRALVDLMLLTGARCGELIGLRPVDIDMSGEVWTYTPASHKTAHHGHGRSIYLGPKAQAVVQSFLDGRPLTATLFSPAEAEHERRRTGHAKRKTPLSCGNVPGSNRRRKPKRAPREAYTVDAVRRAIARACETAGVPRWHPHQLRHNAATSLRREHGIEVARVILGHRSAGMTEVYAEMDRARAVDVIGRVG